MAKPSTIRTLAELRIAFRRERKAMRLTQAEVATRSGMRRETIVKLEAGRNIDVLTLLKAVSALGKSLQIIDRQRFSYEEIQQMFDAEDPDE